VVHAGNAIWQPGAALPRIEDIGLLRYGAMDAVFGGIRAPSTLGSFPRSCARAASGSSMPRTGSSPRPSPPTRGYCLAARS
jgi:hypothetical protein